MPTITYGAGLSLTPDLVLGHEFKHTSRNVVHALISSPIPAVTLRPAAAKAGPLRLFFLTEADALHAADAHTQADVFTYLDDERPALNMRYVVNGDIEVALDELTMKRWTVTVPYQSIGAP